MTAERAERSVLVHAGIEPAHDRQGAGDRCRPGHDRSRGRGGAGRESRGASGTVAAALREGDWRGRPRTFRMNGLDTPWFVHDLLEVIEGAQGSGRPDRDAQGRPGGRRPHGQHHPGFVGGRGGDGTNQLVSKTRSRMRPGLRPLRGDRRCQLCASKRLSLALATTPRRSACRTAAIGTLDHWDADYPGHRWDYALQRILVASRAAGRRAIDGPYADFRDLDGFRISCLTARALGYDGKWCIHPAQVPVANEVFTPNEAEIAWAREVIAANDEAERDRPGIVRVQGPDGRCGQRAHGPIDAITGRAHRSLSLPALLRSFRGSVNCFCR